MSLGIGVISILVLGVGLGAILLEVKRARGLLEAKLAELIQAATGAGTPVEPRSISIGPISVVVETKKPEKVSKPRRRTVKPPATPAIEPIGETDATI
ncbi:MAG TPA: hypothetical protein VJB69_00110 [Candidatus Paceibacterota bacterium]